MTKRTLILVIAPLIGLLTIFLVIAFGNFFNPIPKDAKIILNRRGCMSKERATPCPVYTVTINGDGSAVFMGEYFVHRIGTVRCHIPKKDIRILFEEVEKANFFSLADDYLVEVPEYTGASTTITMDGRTKEVDHYGAGCDKTDPALDNGPKPLCRLEELIDEIAQTNTYIYGLE